MDNAGVTNRSQLKLGNQYDHELVFGVRYAFNAPAPVPPPMAPTPVAVPAPAPARSYLVFFDWDKADLTERARSIVKEAADNSTHVQVTRIEVNGYTDTSGKPTYNQGLSMRRAQAVAGELVRDGVPQQRHRHPGLRRYASAGGHRPGRAGAAEPARGDHHPLIDRVADVTEGAGGDIPRPFSLSGSLGWVFVCRVFESPQSPDGGRMTIGAKLQTMQDTHIIDRVSEEHLWNQVLTRQAGADFLYAVTTMGVYCRPACPSPRPLRKNVRFFRSPPEAEAAGFRACKRCDPKGERARIAQEVVRDASDFIEASEEIPSLEALAKRSGYSRFHFLRMFRDHTGLTPRSYAEGVRARRLHAALAGRGAGDRRGGGGWLRLRKPRV